MRDQAADLLVLTCWFLGLDIDGLYRVSGNLAVIQKLRFKADHGKINQCVKLINSVSHLMGKEHTVVLIS